MGVIHAKEHIPNFCDPGRAPYEAEVESVDDLVLVPWISRWRTLKGDSFIRWSASEIRKYKDSSNSMLMVEYKKEDSTRGWWVVAYLTGDIPVDLPPFAADRKLPQEEE